MFFYNKIIKKLGLSLDLDKHEYHKIVWLTVTFFCVIGSYTVLKEMKDVLFAQIVGSDCLYIVKILSMIVLLPATLLYARLVDKMNRLHLLMFYSFLYGIGGIVIAYFLADPAMGLANKTPDCHRYFGWVIYLFYEGVVPFVVSVFWAFCNSITGPETAKKGYALIIAGSKLGGMFMAGTAWLLFSHSTIFGVWNPTSIGLNQFLLVFSSLVLAISPFFISYLMKSGSKKELEGYHAVYKFEEEQEKEGKSDTGVLSGISMFYKYPYILGIFGIFFFYELINVVLGIQRTIILQTTAKDAIEFSGQMFEQRFWMHFVGFFVSFFGSRILIKKLGERICLTLMPIIVGGLLCYLMLAYDATAIKLTFMALGMLNYSFSSPLREALYIPTVKDIRFKSKSWIESFGQRFAKSCGSGVIGFIGKIALLGSPLYMMLFSSFYATVIILWTILAWFLGKKYESVVKNKEIIGG
ncbi:hypothetical protein HYV11_03905 [Candidatus Dependentiae bacterium]|nr:hypothetical protein [Candidatus Dependentiae bacterium]